MKICSYVMTRDTGFAPNPFHGFCTLAACTPNHQGAKLIKGDWIAGFFTDTEPPCLVYAMQVDKIIRYDDYYRDSLFQCKKPRLSGSAEERCGDNLYHRNRSGKWIRDKGPYHQDDHSFDQDTRYAIVYVGTRYAYFGGNAYANRLPANLNSVLNVRGIKYTRQHNPCLLYTSPSPRDRS